MFKSEWSGKDFYKVLGIGKKATPDEIKKGYRKKARLYHPDTSKEKNAETRFKEVTEAYEVLSDPKDRSSYDAGEMSSAFGSGMPDFSNMSDFSGFGSTKSRPSGSRTGSVFGDNTSGYNAGEWSDIDDLLDKVQETTGTDFRKPNPSGKPKATDSAGFNGLYDNIRNKASRVKDSWSGDSSASSLEEISVRVNFTEAVTGAVKSAQDSAGRSHTVHVPSGSSNGSMFASGGDKGFLVRVSVDKDHNFTVEGGTLTVNWGIPLEQAVEGGILTIPTPYGDPVRVRIPKNSANKKFLVRGKGPNGTNLAVKPFIELPETLNSEHISAAQDFAKA